MKRSKRIEVLDQRPVNLDGFINEWPEMGFVAMKSPYDPEPSVKVQDGRIVELDGKLCIAQNVPPMGYKVIPQLVETNSATVTADTIDNKYFTVKFAPNGFISSIYDKQEDRELLRRSFFVPTYTIFFCVKYVLNASPHAVPCSVRTGPSSAGFGSVWLCHSTQAPNKTAKKQNKTAQLYGHGTIFHESPSFALASAPVAATNTPLPKIIASR